MEGFQSLFKFLPGVECAETGVVEFLSRARTKTAEAEAELERLVDGLEDPVTSDSVDAFFGECRVFFQRAFS